jgi:hypothetical protein
MVYRSVNRGIWWEESSPLGAPRNCVLSSHWNMRVLQEDISFSSIFNCPEVNGAAGVAHNNTSNLGQWWWPRFFPKASRCQVSASTAWKCLRTREQVSRTEEIPVASTRSSTNFPLDSDLKEHIPQTRTSWVVLAILRSDRVTLVRLYLLFQAMPRMPRRLELKLEDHELAPPNHHKGRR